MTGVKKNFLKLTLDKSHFITEIQNKFALPNTPKYVCDVELEAGTHIREGEVNPLEGWGSGGGTQYDLIGQRIGNFKNERLLEGN